MAWINLIAPKAIDIAKSMTLSPNAKALLASNPNMSAGEFTQSLASHKMNTDAVGFLSRGMKPEAGVQWASESAAKVAPKLPPSEVKAAQLAKAWTQGQVSPRALSASLAQNPPQGPGTWAAQAASLASKDLATPAVAAPSLAAPSMASPSLGSLGAPALAGMSAPAMPAIAAPTELTSTAIAGSVHLSAAVDTGALQMVSPAVDGMPAMPLTAPTVPTAPGMPAMTLPSQLTPPQMAQINDSLSPFVDLGMKIAQGQSPATALSSAGTSALKGMMPGIPTLPV